MYVSRLGLVDFRSYAEVVIPLSPGVTTFIGRNGQGKTNLMEALGYASSLGSHRVAQDAPLVRAGADRALVRVEVQRADRAQLIEIEIVPGRANRARLNRSPTTRARDVLGVLRTVLFAPEDLALVKGDPSERRRYLDELVVARQPRFAAVRSDYDRVLKQRNALLKSAGTARSSTGVEETLVVWDEQLAAVGSELMVARAELVQELGAPAASSYAGLAPDTGDLTLSISSSLGDDAVSTDRPQLRELFQQALVARRREELARGITVIGPHRDDLVITLGQHPAKGYASHGESWSCALSLRLAAYDLLRDRDEGGDPVLILDDVFAELDSGRRQRLAEMVAGAEQVLITAAVPDDVPAALVGQVREVVGGVDGGIVSGGLDGGAESEE